jgi:cytochrome P450
MSDTKPSVLTKPEHIKLVFRDSDQHYKAVDNNSGFFMRQILGQCVGLISGAQWRAAKGVVEPPFLHKSMQSYISLVQRQTVEYFQTLEKKENFLNGLLDPVGDVKMLPFWIIANIIYGDLSQELQETLRKLAPQREALFMFVIRGGLTRFWLSQFLPLEANRKLKEFNDDWASFNGSAYRHAKALGVETPFTAMQDAVGRGEITQAQLLQTIDEMLFANLDVTMGGISWHLVFLAANPHIQDKLREEIQQQGHLSAPDVVSPLNDYLASSSSLLAACILEAARLKPLAAFSVPQAAPTDRLIDGYRIPARTNYVIDAYALHLRNPFWGPDSAIYRPERFLERKGPELRYNYWRFGFGPRQCMGKHVADLIIRTLTVHVLEHYTLKIRETGEDWKRIADTWISHPEILLLCEKRERQEASC